MRLLYVLELSEGEQSPRPAPDLARAVLKRYHNSVIGAAHICGVSRQSFSGWLGGKTVSLKHLIFMGALLAIDADSATLDLMPPVDTSVDADPEITTK